MTTDLTGDFELGEDEFDWDVFLPDPDEAEIEAEAAALEDEAELDLDDSDFDWEAALREDGDPESGAEDGARAGAAYDRIVDTVRRSFEEPEAEAVSDPDAEAEAELELIAVQDSVSSIAPDPGAEPEPELEPEPGLEPAVFIGGLVLVSAPDPELEPEPEPDRVSDLASTDDPVPTDELGPFDQLEPADDGPATTIVVDIDEEPDFEPQWGSAVSFAAEPDLEPETEVQPQRDQDQQSEALFVATPDPGPAPEFELAPEFALAPEFEWEPEPEPFSPLAEPEAAAASVWAVESAPMTPPELEPTWATAPAGPGEDSAAIESETDPMSGEPGEAEDGEATGGHTKRSRVFVATVVLASLFLVAVVALVAVRALHHPTDTVTATAPATARPPAHTAPAASPSSDAARLQSATDSIDSATTAASVGLTSLTAFPTPTNVETVINPYISSLQLYENVLSGSKVPAAARPAAASAKAQLRQDLQFLETIDGLPAAQLGTYLAQFDSDATRLQTTLSRLEQNLPRSAS